MSMQNNAYPVHRKLQIDSAAWSHSHSSHKLEILQLRNSELETYAWFLSFSTLVSFHGSAGLVTGSIKQTNYKGPTDPNSVSVVSSLKPSLPSKQTRLIRVISIKANLAVE